MDININEITKKMTREEFLNCIEDGYFYYNISRFSCPRNINLKDYTSHNQCFNFLDKKMCTQCWKNSIKNIKFKGEDEMKINQELWNEFLKGNVVVNCETEDEAKNLFKYCKIYNLKWCDDSKIELNETEWYHNRNNTCYFLTSNLTLTYSRKSHCENNNYNIITYQQLISLTLKEKTISGEEKKTYKGWEILKMIDEGILKKEDKYTRLKTKNHNGDIISESTFIVGDSVEPNLISIKEDTFTIEIKEKEYLDLEGAISISGLEGKNLKHKDWDNYVPKKDVMPNLVYLIKSNKLNVEDLNKKVWEVEE